MRHQSWETIANFHSTDTHRNHETKHLKKLAGLYLNARLTLSVQSFTFLHIKHTAFIPEHLIDYF